MTEDPAGILARTARGAGWVVAWRMATRAVGLASTLVLARLLLPEDFGLVALATALMGGLELCLAFGVEDQIVRARDPGPALYDTAFTLNLLRGLAVGAALTLGAAPAAAFLGDARLETILLALAASAAASGLASIRTVDLRRNMAFEREFALFLAPRLAAAAFTVAAAFVLRNHWALVLGLAVQRAGLVAASYALCPYRPRLSLGAWRELAGVSSWAWATSVAVEARDRMDVLVVGRTLGAAPAGIYAVGFEAASLPTTELAEPVCRAAMPGFAAALRSPGGAEETRAAFLRVSALLAAVTLPAGTGIALVAGPFVALAFGQAWLAAAPLVAVLGVACAAAPFGSVSVALLLAQGRLKALFALTASAAALRAALLLALIPPFGLLGAAVGAGLATAAEHAASVGCAARALRLPGAALLDRIWRPAAAAAAMALALRWAGLAGTEPKDAAAAAALLAAGVPLGAAVYAAALGALWLAAGRPAGAETDALALLRRFARDAAERLRRTPAASPGAEDGKG